MKYIIVDLEATCWRKREHSPNEIIEIGAVCIDEHRQIMDEFVTFVRPKVHPILSDFCTELTSITQSDVQDAPAFPEALSLFQDWMGSFEDETVLCSWGFYDRVQFKNDCELHGLPTDWLSAHMSIKHQHGKIRNLKRPIGMKKALQKEGFALDGTHHRGIDDARNMSKIFIKYFDQWEFPTSKAN